MLILYVSVDVTVYDPSCCRVGDGNVELGVMSILLLPSNQILSVGAGRLPLDTQVRARVLVFSVIIGLILNVGVSGFTAINTIDTDIMKEQIVIFNSNKRSVFYIVRGIDIIRIYKQEGLYCLNCLPG